jgi:sugar phosphate isomerase/epimerase
MTPISIQLYTLREQAAQDLYGVLRLVAEIGFQGVEPAGLHGHDPKEVARAIRDLGVVVSSSHVPLPTADNIEQIVETEQTLGNRHVVSGFGPEHFATIDDCKRSADLFRTAAELLKPHGMTFSMHNHEFEFAEFDGKLAYDIVLDSAPDIFSELDIYWAAYGGINPAEIVAQRRSRIALMHVKDGNLTPDRKHTAVGQGKVDIPGIIQAADPDILKWLVVELDDTDGDMTTAVRESYRYLTAQGLACGNR